MREIFKQLKKDDKKKIITCYNNLANYYFVKKGELLLFEKNPFDDFIRVLDPLVAKLNFYDFDQFVDIVQYYLTSVLAPKAQLKWEDVEELVDYIDETFSINKEEHFLIFPLERSELKKDITFEISRF